MKEVNEVVQKVYGGEKPVPLWLEDEEPSSAVVKRILFTLIIRIKVYSSIILEYQLLRIFNIFLIIIYIYIYREYN